MGGREGRRGGRSYGRLRVVRPFGEQATRGVHDAAAAVDAWSRPFVCRTTVGQAHRRRPSSRAGTRTTWELFAALVCLFAVEYVCVELAGLHGFDGSSRWSAAVVSLLLLLGAVFALLVAHVSLETVQVIRRVASLEGESVTDRLMRIRDRRYLHRRLRREFARSRRYGLPLSALLIDVDQTNDGHGHGAGDRVLVRLGAILRRSVRESDVVARYDDEQIVVLATGTDAADAATLAERVRFVVKAGLAKGEGPPCTVSIGIATLDASLIGAEGLLLLADDALYVAKRSGGNRVVGARPAEGATSVASPRGKRSSAATPR